MALKGPRPGPLDDGDVGRADLYDISMFNSAFVRTVILGAALLLCLNAAPVHAQLRGKIAVGASAGTFQPSASELSTKSVVFIPTISRVPKQGWRVAVGLNWFNADVDGSFVNIPDQFENSPAVRSWPGSNTPL